MKSNLLATVGRSGVVIVVLTCSILLEVPSASAAVPPPGSVVEIASPTSGSTIAGQVSVVVNASTPNTPGDLPSSITLAEGRVGGPSDTESCDGSTQNSYTCTATFALDYSQWSGTDSLQATLTTTNGETLLSDAVVVNVANQVTVSLTSPTSGQILHSPATVTLAASAPATYDDNGAPTTWPGFSSLAFGYDWYNPMFGGPTASGAFANSSSDCSAGSTTCVSTFLMDVSTMSGWHYIWPEAGWPGFNPEYVQSNPTLVGFYSATTSRITSAPSSVAGTAVVVRGVVRAVNDGAAAPGIRVTVAGTPTIGARWSRTVTTSSTGAFAFTIAPSVRTRLSVAAAGTDLYGASSASASLVPKAPLRCAWAYRYTNVGKVTPGHCSTPNMANGTAGTLQVWTGSTWVTAVHLTAYHGTYTWYLRPNQRGNVRVRLVLPTTANYAATTGPTLITTVL